MIELTPKNVFDLASKCFFDDEVIEKYDGTPPQELWAKGGGIVRNLVFDKRKIEEHKNEIKELLLQLPDEFMDKEKQGISFIKMPFKKDGTQWGEQTHAELLMALGKAAGMVWYTPRELWALTLGVPIVQVLQENNDDK